LDDSVFGPIAGGLTALVAAVTAMFSGHAMFGTHPSLPPHHSEVVEVAGYSDSGSDSSPPTPWFDSGTDTEGRDTGEPKAPAKKPLCDRILIKEAGIDTMNEHLDGLLTEVRSRRSQRLK
jgi:hypothetical protein